MEEDPRFKAFCSSQGQEVFHSVTHHHQIWRPDPHDVEIIHREARDGYELLLNRVDASRPADAGRILLLLGESGAGKTHLMRVFRNLTHEHGNGYFSYMQMTSAVTNYARYVLRYTVDSFDKIYYEPMGSTTGLMRLSNALAEDENAVPKRALEMLRSVELSHEQLSDLIYKVADRLVAIERFRNIDLDLIRALLYLQPGDPAINAKIFKFLRCEPLTPYDSGVIGGMVSRAEEDDPQRMLHSLARLVKAVESGALVVCLDQLEDIQQLEQAEQKFRSAVQTVISLAEIPNVVVLIACLEDFYELLRGQLPQTHIDRVELDPAPVRLEAERTGSEVELLITRRLSDLYDAMDIEFRKEDPLYPFSPEKVQKLTGLRTRAVLDWCREQREQCAAGPGPIGPEPPETELDQLWNDHLTGTHPVPESDAALLQMLGTSIERCAGELTTGHRILVTGRDGLLDVDIKNTSGIAEQQLTAGVCQKSARGGALARQIDQLVDKSAGRNPAAVRSTDYPSNPKTKIAQRIGEFVSNGGRRVVVADSDWRSMVAMESFLVQHVEHPEFQRWLQSDCPLSRLPSLQQLLDLDSLKASDQFVEDKSSPCGPQVPKPVKIVAPTKPWNPPAVDGPTILGLTRDYQPSPLILSPNELVRHAAFLGGSGSGKTTVALNLIEQLLMRGIPAVLVDRKGDLCSYARKEAWETPIEDPQRAAARDYLRSKIDVALFTPGAIEGQGRPLSISIAPPGLGELSTGERQQLANFAAMALGGVMSYKSHGLDKQRLAILGQAIAVLSELDPEAPLSLERLMDFIDSVDPVLVNAIGKLDTKHFKKLVEDLQTLSLLNGHLFRGGQEQLSAENLLGLGAGVPSDRTRLSIISTASLGDNANVLFWIAQLLLEIGRYAARNPSNDLQAVIMFDEADMYLPAQSRPATKEPMESLLKRARSAGIGLMLATQSPGDLDYKSRDQISSWFVGKVKENTALNKLRPMLAEAKTDVSAKLAGQRPGEFYVIRDGEVASLKANMSLIHAQQVPAEEILWLASDRQNK